MKISRSGLTLVELLIVVALVALMTGLAVALFRNGYERHHLEHYVKDLSAYFRYAQYRAIERGKTQQLRMDEGNKLQTLTDEANNGRLIEMDDPFLRGLNHQSNYRLYFDNSEGIYFFPDGNVTRNRLVVSDEETKLAALEVTNRIGHVRIELAGGNK